jgi:hypothetical protein
VRGAFDAVRFLAIVLTALALVPAGAHLAALPNKLDLPREAYFVAQAIYRGWALFGVVLFAALGAHAAHAWLLRRRDRPFGLALAALVLMLAGLAIFFGWTHPANQATQNWTVAPPNWEALRTQWEYSHAAHALLTFGALCCAVLAALRTYPVEAFR